jgi:hypothetical protein
MPPVKGFVDVVDFFSKWPETRRRLEPLVTDPRLAPDQRDILRAMIFVLDCVGPQDLEAE